ncbi:receptor-like protein EIX1 [Cornus florida]|uniref:receptor-like protein EIX1 n=1 Tax=Cornus florida TaxID=4283 RepID=UPI00289BCF24|nr:receptor-like protein EIX1 [Cornus florida]
MANNNAYMQLLALILLSGCLYLENIRIISCHGYLDTSCVKIEKEALLKFKGGLTDPSGRLSSWVGENCCQWSGIRCDNETGHVIKLNLHNSFPDSFDGDGTTHHLGGEINPSLLDLKYLNYLDLSMNNFVGLRTPSFFGSLEKLRYLNLSSASFSSIPQNLGKLSSLQYLDLNRCCDISNKTDLTWLYGLSSLKHLNLGYIDLSNASDDWLQALNMLPSLLELHLPACGLSKLPLSLSFVNFSSLLVLDLSNNDFSSSIPYWLFNVSKLQYLDLSSNNLRGTIPNEFSSMTSIQTLDLSENAYIGGQLSRDLGNMCNLQELDLSLNNISGEITELIDGLSRCANSSLEVLDLGYNKLGGCLPSSLGSLKNLKRLQLWRNSFLGSIPGSIGNLSSLKELYLSENQMNGTIPKSLGQLSSLVALDITENSWEGVVTEAHLLHLKSLKELCIGKFSFSPEVTLVFNVSSLWLPPFKLQYLDLSSCQLGPKFPEWLRNQNDLNTLVLRNTRISGSIPDWLWKLDLQLDELDLSYNQLRGRVPNSLNFHPQSTLNLIMNCFEGPLPLWSSNVSELYLSNNLFSGPIPPNIGKRMPMLTDLDLSHNSLNGTIPLSIGRLIDLTTLDISNNHLSGGIPGFWHNITTLFLIDMSNNSLSGEIPTSMGCLTSLRFLMLSNNHLSGEFPSLLQNCSNMVTLSLGENRFYGSLPSWIGERMPSLSILSLRSNLFNGSIPVELCHISYLHILDLAENNLSGSIPPCLGNLKGMKSELSSTTRFEGQLLLVSKGRVLLFQSTLYLVHLIDLSSNSLSGEVPEELANLSRMCTLNLSINHLTGNIPHKIGKLQNLETLDLSRNQLSGPIPYSMTLLTSLNHLNLSDNNLSGEIPLGNQFGTLNDPSIYKGNPGLCGPPLTINCSRSPRGDGQYQEDDEEEDGDEFDWPSFYISMGLGFVVGFWGVFGVLLVKKSWRYAYFRLVDDMKDRFMVVVLINFARLRRIMEQQRN